MAANTLSITNSSQETRYLLHGDMDVAFDTVVDDGLCVNFFTVTNEEFLFKSSQFQFKDTSGMLVNKLVFGGKAGLFIELRFNLATNTWYITANNLITKEVPNTSEFHLVELAVTNTFPELDGQKYDAFYIALSNPTNLIVPLIVNPRLGFTYKIFLQQDTTGNRKVTFNSKYKFSSGGTLVLSTNPGQIDYIKATPLPGGIILCEVKLWGDDNLSIVIVSPDAPINADARPNGVVWYQSALVNGAVRQWIKINGVYQSVANPSVAIVDPVPPPLEFRSAYTMDLSTDPDWSGRLVLRDSKRTSLIIRNPNARSIQYSRTTVTNDNRNTPSGWVTILPGQEIYVTEDINQYWAQPKGYITTAITSSGTTATAKIPGHDLVTGDKVDINKAAPSGYRAVAATITVVDADTVTYTTATADLAPATSPGTIMVRGLIAEVEILGKL